MRLLVDVNLPPGVARLLNKAGVSATPAVREGWGTLANGNLIRAAVAKDYQGIITRDTTLHIDADYVLRTHPDFAVVIVRLPQVRGAEYLAAFAKALQHSPLRPETGKVLEWP